VSALNNSIFDSSHTCYCQSLDVVLISTAVSFIESELDSLMFHGKNNNCCDYYCCNLNQKES